LNFSWPPYNSTELLSELVDDGGQGLFFLGEDLVATLPSPPFPLQEPRLWRGPDQDGWKSTSTSSSNAECCAEGQQVPEKSIRGAAKPGHPPKSGAHGNDEIFNKAREKNKAAQRAYRQRTKVTLRP
jgi:hypothetical protein